MVSDSFASILRSARADFNARFAEARIAYPNLDARVFSDFLATAVDRLVEAVATVRPDGAAAAASAAFDASIALAGQRLVGAGARASAIEEGWVQVLPRLAGHVAAEPVRVIGAVCNALHHLSSVAGARPAQWIELVGRLGPQCPEVDDLLRLGQVAAWRAGLAHLRAGALEALDRLPQSVACAVVGAAAPDAMAEVQDRLRADPWFDPSTAGAVPAEPSPIRPASEVGEFRGFGGLFLEPPAVAAVDQHLMVRSGEECWWLTADAFGATFHRVPSATFPPSEAGGSLPPGIQIRRGRVYFAGQPSGIEISGAITSVAVTRTTVAVTASLTHRILLLARSSVA